MRLRVLIWLTAIAALELLSITTVFHPYANGIAALAVGIALFVLTVFRPAWGLGALAAELVIGSKGRLLVFGGDAVNDGGISLRMILFAAFLLGWIVQVVWHRAWRSWDASLLKGREWYALLALLLVYGVLLGWRNGNPFLFADANAWGFWLLLLPALDLVTREPRRTKDVVLAASLAGFLWLFGETVLFFAFFTHGFISIGDPSYLWLRRTGVGEVTRLLETRSAFRVFFQSHIYAAIAVVLLTVRHWWKPREGGWPVRLLFYALLTVFISLSRSFWLGIGAALLIAAMIGARKFGRTFWRGLATSAAIVLLSLVTLEAILVIPPPPGGFLHVYEILGVRAGASDPAAISRWQLLPILWNKIQEAPVAGHGFGATVTYPTKDPRAVERTGGVVTAYAFEWGWLDVWIKLGVLGPVALLALLWSLGFRLWHASLPEWLRIGAVSALAALVVIHAFTPYLNHPLGIGLLIAGEALIAYARPKSI